MVDRVHCQTTVSEQRVCAEGVVEGSVHPEGDTPREGSQPRDESGHGARSAASGRGGDLALRREVCHVCEEPVHPVRADESVEQAANERSRLDDACQDLRQANADLRTRLECLEVIHRQTTCSESFLRQENARLSAALAHTEESLLASRDVERALREERARGRKERAMLVAKVKALESTVEAKEAELRHVIRSLRQEARSADSGLSDEPSRGEDSLSNEMGRDVQSRQHSPSQHERSVSPVGSPLEECDLRSLPVRDWEPEQMRQWFRKELSLPELADAAACKIASGRVLLSLGDFELQQALSVRSPLQLKRIRVSLESLRHPAAPVSPIERLDASWLGHFWLDHIGLPQYRDRFLAEHVDARILDVLSARELRTELSVTQPLHVSSLLCSAQLLRACDWTLEGRTGVAFWSNERLCEWLHQLGLEHCDGIRGSGLFGGVLALDATFSASLLSSLLGLADSALLERPLALLLAEAREDVKPLGRRPSRRFDLKSSLSRVLARNRRGRSGEVL